MFEKIPDHEFKNLTRSTIPLLCWWKDRTLALSELEKACGFHDLNNASVIFEFPTSSASPHDKASYTDVMVESLSTAIAIEGKWTEPRYEIVAEWTHRGNLENRSRVLAHWLELIQERAPKLDRNRVQDLPYQMLHRTASACARLNKIPVILYQVFRDQKHVTDYARDLQLLARALGETDVRIWMLEIPVTITEQYQRVAIEAAAVPPEERHKLIRMAVCQKDLFVFGESIFTRIT